GNFESGQSIAGAEAGAVSGDVGGIATIAGSSSFVGVGTIGDSAVGGSSFVTVDAGGPTSGSLGGMPNAFIQNTQPLTLNTDAISPGNVTYSSVNAFAPDLPQANGVTQSMPVNTIATDAGQGASFGGLAGDALSGIEGIFGGAIEGISGLAS